MTNLDVIYMQFEDIRDPRLKQEAIEAITQVAFEELGGVKKDTEYMPYMHNGRYVIAKLMAEYNPHVATNAMASTFTWSETIFGMKFWYRIFQVCPMMVLNSHKELTKL